MWTWVLSIVAFITGDLIKKLLLAAGIGVASSYFFNELIQYLITRMTINFSSLPASFISLLGMFGVDKALSIIIGALFMRASIMAMGLSFKKA